MTGRRVDMQGLFDLLPPMAVRVAATLRLSDLMQEGVTALDDLALKSGTDPDALGRLLRYLVTLDLYRELEAATFTLTAVGRILCDAHPASMRAWLDLEGAGGRMDRAWWGLLDAVRTGDASYAVVHGRDFFADLHEVPERAASFDQLMAGKSARSADELAAGRDWAGVRRVVDVGGGNGLWLERILAAAPHVSGTLLELPDTAARARRSLAASGLASRCDVVEGDFRTGVPAAGDLYLLVDILHDWDDATATELVARCVEAAGADGRVLVVEQLATEPLDRESAAMDLKMLVLLGGRQRSLAQLGALGAAAGAVVRGTAALRSGFSVVELAAPLTGTE